MRKVIPEKMVELWTANAIFAAFGPSTRIWAPTRGFDQTASSVQGKRFVLELKAPKWETSGNQPSGFPSVQPLPSVAQRVEVDIGQLLEYVDTVHLEVIYVLPQPLHYLPAGASTHMALEEQHVRDTFGNWSYVICSSQLLQLIGGYPWVARLKNRKRASPARVSRQDRGPGGRYERRNTAEVVCDMNGSTPQTFSLAGGPGVDVMSLRDFLAMLKRCPFDHPLVERSTRPATAATGAMPEGLQPVEPPDADDAFRASDEQQPERSGRLAGSLLVVEVDVSPPTGSR